MVGTPKYGGSWGNGSGGKAGTNDGKPKGGNSGGSGGGGSKPKATPPGDKISSGVVISAPGASTGSLYVDGKKVGNVPVSSGGGSKGSSGGSGGPSSSQIAAADNGKVSYIDPKTGMPKPAPATAPTASNIPYMVPSPSQIIANAVEQKQRNQEIINNYSNITVPKAPSESALPPEVVRQQEAAAYSTGMVTESKPLTFIEQQRQAADTSYIYGLKNPDVQMIANVNAFGIGIVAGGTTVIRHPIQTAVGMVTFPIEVAKEVIKPGSSEAIFQMKEQATANPYLFAGEVAGQSIVLAAAPKFIPKVKVETIKIGKDLGKGKTTTIKQTTVELQAPAVAKPFLKANQGKGNIYTAVSSEKFLRSQKVKTEIIKENEFFHQTSPENAKIILNEGFDLTNMGGVFLVKGPKAEMIKTASNKGAILKVTLKEKVAPKAAKEFNKYGESVVKPKDVAKVEIYKPITKTTTQFKEIKVQRTATGQFEKIGAKVPETEVRILKSKKDITARVKPEQITEAQGLAQGESKAGFNVLNQVVKLTKNEEVRIKLFKEEIAPRVYKETGLPVGEFIVNIQGVKNAKKVTAIVEKYTSANEGAYFGSLVTKQLPKEGGIKLPKNDNLKVIEVEKAKGSKDYTYKEKNIKLEGEEVITKGYQNIKQGDIDLQFSKKTTEQIRKDVIEPMAKELKAAGEDIGISEGNILEFKSGKYKGEKFLEAKSGIDQATLGLNDAAPAGIAGFEFANLKKGQASKTVAFGKSKAITAGEQTLRKYAGGLMISPGKLPGETAAFSKPGILGKQGNPRGLKDVAGSIQQTAGIAKIMQESANPLRKAEGVKLEKAYQESYKTYSKAQQADIKTKLIDMIGTAEAPYKVPLQTAAKTSTGIKPSPMSILSTGSYFKVRNEPSLFSSKSSTNPSAKSPSTYNYGSASSSPASLSPKSPSSYGYGSPSSISPSSISSGSPISPSPKSPSPGSPSPGSPSPGSPSPGSPGPESPSPGSPGPGSPGSPGGGSPGPKSPSPFSPVSPSIRIPPSRKRIITYSPGPKKKKKSLFRLEVRRKGKFKTAGIFESPELAFISGKANIQQTAAASFRVKNLESAGNVRTIGTQIVPARQFYESKKEGGVFIQKREFRISSAGEKKEITYRGIFASKNRRKI